MRKLSTLITGLVVLVAVAVPVFTPVAVGAAANSQAICQGSGGTWTADSNAPSGGRCTTSDNRTVLGTIQQVTDVLLFIIGAVAVLMIIIGGLRYVTSGGEQNALTGAKNTILYAIIGLLVALMAYALVHFIFTSFNIK